jgi:aspartyl-tRNA(Asn)/glutamyl-tRNA(Gln) amidotransferase subunit A
LCFGSIGTDTGGSIRIPASLCGVVGVKPGLGRVSAHRVIPLSSTLDFVGPLARTVDDAALLLDVIAEHGKSERTFRPVRKTAGRRRATWLGIPKDFFLDVISPEVRKAFERSIEVLKKHGAKFKQVPVPLLQEAEEAGNQIAWTEATLYHEDAGWYPQRAAEYGEDVRVRLEMGTKVSAVTYLRALELREKFIAKFHEMLASNEIDALVAPTTPITATRIGEESVAIDGKDHLTRALLLRLNRPANLAGVPAISVSCGFTKEGLPVGLQFIGCVGQEALLLEIAADFERAQTRDNRRPKFD